MRKILPPRGRWQPIGLTEGQSSPDGFNDMHDHPIEVVQYIGRGNSERFEAVQLRPCIPFCIELRLIATAMGFAIDLDAQFGLRTEEIQNIEPAGALAKFAPEQPFGQGHFLAQSARA